MGQEHKQDLIIVGTSTNARHVFDFIQFYNLFNVRGFAVDARFKIEDTFLGLPVYELETLETKVDKEQMSLFVAIFWNRLNADRKAVYERLKRQGYKFVNVISPNSIIRGKIDGDNCWIHDNVIINTNAIVKSNVMVMANAFIGQGSIVDSHCFCAARSLVASCHIGEQSFLGLSSTVFDGVNIGKKCLVGACCTVKRHMPDYSLCKTVSESCVFQQYDEETIERKLEFRKNVR